MKIKVCGMREPENLLDVAELDPDYIGMIFYPKSPRHMDAPKAVRVLDKFPSIQRVGVFVNPDLNLVLERIEQYRLDQIQLHGDESPGFCSTVQGFAPVIKAFRIGPEFDFDQLEKYQAACDLFVFDAAGEHYGGNGHTFNWELLDQYQGETPFLLSGGIGPTLRDRVLAYRHPRCIGVDVNSGFEDYPGHKDPVLLAPFIHHIHQETRPSS